MKELKTIHLTFDDPEGLDISDTYEKDLITITILGNPVDVKVSDLISAINKIKDVKYQNTQHTINFSDFSAFAPNTFATETGNFYEMNFGTTAVNAHGLTDAVDALRYAANMDVETLQ